MIAGIPGKVPLYATLSGAAVLGENFAGAGELLYRAAGGNWTAALGSIVEASLGYYDYVPTAAEVVGPWFQIRISGVCDEYVWKEDVELDTMVARVLGLNHENALMDGGAGVLTGPTYSAKKVLLSARVRVFEDAAALALASAGAANGADGEIYRYTVTGEDTGAGLAKSFKIARAL